jgi:hypothetical protein
MVDQFLGSTSSGIFALIKNIGFYITALRLNTQCHTHMMIQKTEMDMNTTYWTNAIQGDRGVRTKTWTYIGL